MKELLSTVLKEENIEYFSFLDIADCSVIQPHLMPEGIKAAAIWLIPYYTGPHPERNISLYSISKDYHLFSKILERKIASRLKSAFPDGDFHFFCDSSPIDEVKAAISAGLGVIGRNGLLINEKYGSYVFIGSVLTTLETECEKPKERKNCLGCGKCVSSCDFLAGKKSYCHSSLTQQKNVTDGELAEIRSKKIRWGCDLCQEVCPMNKNVPQTPVSFFYEDMKEYLTPEDIEKMSKAEFSERAYCWRGKKTMIRNLS
ncbi:MAG: epoxyqueuosine reductase [Clostridia bacterium]|nr:epoxyqueuosine reductase [Clostridia bacterium]